MKNPYYQAALENDRQIEFELAEIAAGIRRLNERIDKVAEIRARYGSLDAYYRQHAITSRQFFRLIRVLTRELKRGTSIEGKLATVKEIL